MLAKDSHRIPGGGRGPGGGSPLAGVRGQSPRKKIFGFGVSSQAKNL